MTTAFQQRVNSGQLTSLDGLPHMDPAIGTAIASYSNSINSNRQSYRWLQALVWVENILFGLGRQWNSDILHSRLSRNSDTGDLAVIANVSKKIPQPTNDFVGRYVETNIALLTENRPQPRITAKSDSMDDKRKAELSQLVLDYLWEEHNLPEKHREAARIILYCGIAFMEICYDPTEIRHLAVQQTETENTTAIPGPNGTIQLPVSRQVPVIDPATGAPKIIGELEYGDIVCKLVSPFELHFPQVHSWDEINWVMKENFVASQVIRDRLQADGLKKICTKKNGWDLSVLESLGAFNVQTLPLWWWERLTTAIEGPGPNIYVGNPELWDDHCVIRTFDRKPCPSWPSGRTIITVNDRVLYDSPRDVGARAFDPRWPHRWHPYVRFSWERQVGSILGRSLVSKLLPKIKRINAIDTALIMWRRTVPMAAWIMPRGTSPIEDLQTGRAGVFFEYDPRKTLGAAPQPVPPTPFPSACLEERELCKQEMEAMAGTEEVLRGQRPEGVNCWVEGSKLTNANGKPVEVKDIKVNDMHMSLKGEGPIGFTHTGAYEGSVKTIYSTGNLPVTVTPNHAFPVLPKEVLPSNSNGRRKQIKHGIFVPPPPGQITKRTVNDIQVGDFLLSGFTRPKDEPTVNVDLLWLYGIYLAEGYVSKDKKTDRLKTVSWALNIKEIDIANKIKDIIKTQFNYDVKFQPVPERNGLYVHCHSTEISKHFIQLFNTGSAVKDISEKVFRSSSNLLPLVAGWLDGDGNKDANTYRGSTVSETMAAQLRAICLDAQVYTTISKTEPQVSGDFIGRHPQFTLRISAGDAQKVNVFAVKQFEFVEGKNNKGRKGFWYEGYYASRVSKIDSTPYNGAVYNVTMNDFTGCDNSVNAFGLYTYQSAIMLDVLRKQALSSRSAIIQGWDESLQFEGSAMLMEVIKHVKNDSRYLERLKVLSREKASRLTIDSFSGADLSDNVIVKVDTASQAMGSREAKQARAIEIMQYAPGLVQLPITLQEKLVDDLGWPDTMQPKSQDIIRAKNLISYIKNNRFDIAVPFKEDDPYVIHEILVEEAKTDAFIDLPLEQQVKIFELIDEYQREIERIERAQLKMQSEMAAMQAEMTAPPEGS